MPNMEKMIILDGYNLVRDFNLPSHPDSPAAWHRILEARVVRGVAYARSILEWARGVRKNYMETAKSESPLLEELRRYVESQEDMANDLIERAREVKKDLLNDLIVPSTGDLMPVQVMQEDLTELLEEHQRCVHALAEAKTMMQEVQSYSKERAERLGAEIDLLKKDRGMKKRDSLIRSLQDEVKSVHRNLDKTVHIFNHHSRREQLCLEEVVKKADELLDEVCRIKGENQSRLLTLLHDFYMSFEHAGRARLKRFHKSFHKAEREYGVVPILKSMKEGVHYYIFANMSEWLRGESMKEPLPLPTLTPKLSHPSTNSDVKKKSNVSVVASRDQCPLLPRDLQLKKGMKVKQVNPMNKNGLAYGWVRPYRFRADKTFGFYPGDAVQSLSK